MKVTLNPIKEIKITHLHRTTVKNLTKLEAITESPKLFWCNKILFNYYEFGGEKLNIELAKGIFYLDSFTYAICEEKIDVAKWNGYAVEVSDLTGHSNYEELTKQVLEI